MNVLGSFTQKEDFTHHKGMSADGYQINNMSTTPVTASSVYLATPNIVNYGYTNVGIATASSNATYQLDVPIIGVRKILHCASLAATSMPAYVYAGNITETCFLTAAGNTSNGLATMYQGTVLELLAISTNKWLVTSNCTAGSTVAVSFTSST